MTRIIIPNRLASVGLSGETYPELSLFYNKFTNDGWYIVDVRDLYDEPGHNTLDDYRNKIKYAVECLDRHNKIVIGCTAGISRSNAIATAVLLERFEFKTLESAIKHMANLGINLIEPCHLKALSKLYKTF